MRRLFAALAALALCSSPVFAQSYCAPVGSVSMIVADGCPYCAAAERFFAANGVPVRIRDIGPLWNLRAYGLPAVPIIRVGNATLRPGFDAQIADELRYRLCLR